MLLYSCQIKNACLVNFCSTKRLAVIMYCLLNPLQVIPKCGNHKSKNLQYIIHDACNQLQAHSTKTRIELINISFLALERRAETEPLWCRAEPGGVCSLIDAHELCIPLNSLYSRFFVFMTQITFLYFRPTFQNYAKKWQVSLSFYWSRYWYHDLLF